MRKWNTYCSTMQFFLYNEEVLVKRGKYKLAGGLFNAFVYLTPNRWRFEVRFGIFCYVFKYKVGYFCCIINSMLRVCAVWMCGQVGLLTVIILWIAELFYSQSLLIHFTKLKKKYGEYFYCLHLMDCEFKKRFCVWLKTWQTL